MMHKLRVYCLNAAQRLSLVQVHSEWKSFKNTINLLSSQGESTQMSRGEVSHSNVTQLSGT